MTELNAARNCSADAVWMVAPDAATARANSSLARPCCIAISSSISAIARQATKIGNKRRAQLLLDIDVHRVVQTAESSDRK